MPAASRRSAASTPERWFATSATAARCAAGSSPPRSTEADAHARVRAEPPMDGADLARTVSPGEPVELSGDGPHVVGIDTGIKLSIIRQFRERGCRLTLLPCTASADEVLARDPDLVFLANGPGDPAALDYVVERRPRSDRPQAPVVGICLGHQLLCRAVGLETFKLPFGHRGANHPVKELSRPAGSRSPLRTTASPFARPDGGETDRGRRASPLGDRLRGGGALPPEPLRPHRRGPGAQGGPRLHGPVPPRGRPGTARRAASVRSLPRAGGGGADEQRRAAREFWRLWRNDGFDELLAALRRLLHRATSSGTRRSRGCPAELRRTCRPRERTSRTCGRALPTSRPIRPKLAEIAPDVVRSDVLDPRRGADERRGRRRAARSAWLACGKAAIVLDMGVVRPRRRRADGRRRSSAASEVTA